MKNLLFFLSILIILCLGVFVYQWSTYKQETTDSTHIKSPFLSIDLVESDDQFLVRNTYTGLPPDTYTLFVPDKITLESCQDQNGDECVIKKNKLMVSDFSDIHFNYRVPITKGEIVKLTDWELRLEKEHQPIETKSFMHLTSPKDTDFVWYTHNQNNSKLDKENIHFYSWEYENPNVPKYILGLPKEYKYTFQLENLLFIGDEPINKEQVNLSILPYYNGSNLLVLLKPDSSMKVEKEFISLPNWNINSLNAAIFESYLLQKGTVKEEEKWLLQIVENVLFDETIGMDFKKELARQLNLELSPNQKENWKQLLMKSDQFGNLATMLDNTLGEIFQKQVHFFTLNQANKNDIIPLFILDTREMYWGNEKLTTEWKPILYKEELYFPLAGISMVAKMELYVLNNKTEFFIRHNSNSYRLYLDRDNYQINEKNFEINKNWIININGEIYIHKLGLEDIFKLQVSETSTEIDLQFDK